MISYKNFFLLLMLISPIFLMAQKGNSLKEKNHFNLKSIDKTPPSEIQKIKTSIKYPLNYKTAFNNLEKEIKTNKSNISLFNYTLLSEENRGTADLSEENIKLIMNQNLEKSTLILSQNELDKPYWPKLASHTHFLFRLSYNMDGFQALFKFVVKRDSGKVAIEEIAD